MNRFFKLLLLLCIATVFSSSAYAFSLNKDQAAVIGANWVYERGGEAPSGSSVDEITVTGMSYYIVSFDRGWVILEKEPIGNPVVGYSLHGEIGGIEKIHRVLEGRSNDVGIQSEFSIKTYLASDFIPSNKKRATVGPLVETAWGQEVPYNQQCPEDSGSETGHVLTGCGATSLSQLMAYWKYPEVGYGERSYQENDYGVLSVDFSDQQYNWDNMTDDDIAKINYHTGVSVKMDYGVDGSSSYIDDIMSALKMNFGYSHKIQFVKRSDYSSSEWAELLANEIKEERPVLFRADEKGDKGHIWIMDGFDDQGYFHMNWGWDGALDGFFSLDDLVVDGIKYYDDQGALINIFPQKGAVDFKPNLLFESDTAPRIFTETGLVTDQDLIFMYDFMYNNGRADQDDPVEFSISVKGEKSVEQTGETQPLKIDVLPALKGVYIGYLPAGEYTATLVADPLNKIDELDETDNEITISFTVDASAERSDLELVYHEDLFGQFTFTNKVDSKGFQTVFSADDKIYLNMAIGNTGDVATETAFKYKVVIDDKVTAEGECAALDAGEKKLIENILIGENLSVGEHAVYVIVDSDSEIVEKNENNIYSYPIEVKEALLPNLVPYAPTGWDAPVVASYSLDKMNPLTLVESGKEFYLLLSYANSGASGVYDYYSYDITVNGEQLTEYEIKTGMSAGESAFMYVQMTLQEGTYDLTFTIDSNDDIKESDEEDNSYSISLKAMSDFPAPSKPTGPESVCEGADFVVKVANEGTPVVWSFTDNAVEGNTETSDNDYYYLNITPKSGFEGDVEVKAGYEYPSGAVYSAPLTVYVSGAVDVPVSAMQQKIMCDGASVEISIDENTNTILWSNGETGNNITVNEVGVYKAKAENQYGCESGWVDVAEVSVFASQSLFENNETAVCDGSELEADADVDVIWYDSGLNEIDGNPILIDDSEYYYKYSAGTCVTEMLKVDVSVKDVPVDVVISGEGSLLTVSVDMANSYSWYKDDALLPESGQNIVADSDGDYKVVIELENSCEVSAEYQFVATGVDGIDSDMLVTPTLVEDYFAVTGAEGYHFSVISLSGKASISGEIDESVKKIQCSHLPSGMYVVKVFSDTGTSVLYFVKK